MLTAARNGDVEKIRDLLMLASVDVNMKNHYGSTPLIVAASKGHVHVMEELIFYGADLNAQNQVLGTALMYACANGYSRR